MNNLARDHLKIDCKELKLQKLNFVYDLKHGKAIFLLMKEPNPDPSMKYNIQKCFSQVIYQVNISTDKRS